MNQYRDLLLSSIDSHGRILFYSILLACLSSFSEEQNSVMNAESNILYLRLQIHAIMILHSSKKRKILIYIWHSP
jgi:hypothetical protein